MIDANLRKLLGEDLRVVPPEGMEIGDGSFKTAHGTIRIPKSELQRARNKKSKQVHFTSTAGADQTVTVPVKTYPITVHSEIGVLTVLCREIYKCDRYLVLGLADTSFQPKSYAEDPKLRLDIEVDEERAKYIYTGCKWQQECTGITFVVLMKG